MRGWFPSQPQQTLAAIGLVIALFASGAASGGVLSEGDFKQAENLKLLFANLMNDLVATVNRPDVASGDLSCVNSTIRELVQISDELASYEYLITIEKQMADVGDDSPMRDVVKFAIEKSNMILTEERKRLAQVSDQCAKYPLGYGKIQQALQVIDTTTSILASIRSHV